MSLIEKIDAEIASIRKIIVSGTLPAEVYGIWKGKLQMAEQIKELILSSQPKPLTIGDKIRESNESLAEFINEVLYYCIYKSKYKSNCGECRLFEVCRKAEGSDAGWYLDYLNQPYKD